MDEELAKLLKIWFKTADFNDRNFMFRDETAKIIKKEMMERGRWKNLPRGNPRKGYLKSIK